MTMFTVADQEFGWEEIVAAAQAWGEWQPFVESVRQSLCCLRSAEEAGELPSAAEMRETTTAFRYAHNLISAEETKTWLARRQMSVEDWMSCLRARRLQERSAERPGRVVTHPISDAEVAGVIKIYAVCSGRLDEWAVRLAGRAALAATSGPIASGSPRELIARIETEYERQQRQAVTPKRIESKIADHRLDWIRFACRYVWFPEERIAREASFCLTEDGLTLDEVASDSRGVVQRWDFYLDEIEAAARPHFLAARAGDWLGPIRLLAGFPLFAVVAKTMPAAADPRVRGRAERAIVEGLTKQAMNERVRWAAVYSTTG